MRVANAYALNPAKTNTEWTAPIRAQQAGIEATASEHKSVGHKLPIDHLFVALLETWERLTLDSSTCKTPCH